jgi:hypothetical protein
VSNLTVALLRTLTKRDLWRVALCQRHATSHAHGVNSDLRWFPANVSVSCLDGSTSYPKATLTAVLGKELDRLCFEVSAARIHVANADCVVSDIDDLRPSKKATASQQDGEKRNPHHRFQ